MSRKQAECLLAAVIFARSTSLLFAKIGLNSFTPLNLLAVRFCLAFAVLAVIFWKKLRAATKPTCGTVRFWVPPSPLCCWNRPTCPEQPGNGV